MRVVAVVLTHNRPELLARCVEAVSPQVDLVNVIDNCSEPPAERADFRQPNVAVTHDPGQPPNIGRMWVEAVDRFPAEYHAFLCDDAIVPAGWVPTVISDMLSTGADAGSTHQLNPMPWPNLKKAPDGDVVGRMCGWAFVVRAASGIRPDPTLHWWWVDTDIDWQARHRGGMVIAAGPVVQNELPNDFTYKNPELMEQTGRDGETFVAKWGSRPW